jgi:hypothetical protein
MTTNDHWVEVLRCPRCRKTGTAELTEIGDSHDINIKVKADRVPEGFMVHETEHGINFYCSSYDCPAEL